MHNMLLFGMNFREYEPQIIKQFERFGYMVDWFLDLDLNLIRIERTLSSSRKQKVTDDYHKKILGKIANKKYDLVLVIVGRYMTSYFLSEIKKLNPNARFILYLWDDISRVGNFENVRSYYHKIYTIDTNDMFKYNLSLLPLFYIEDFILSPIKKNDMENQIFSVMADYSNRYTIAKDFLNENGDFGTKIVLVTGGRNFKNRLNSMVDRTRGIEFRMRSMKMPEVVYNIRHSAALFDVPYSKQSGLTIRTIETIGAQRKLITTNKNIIRYDFFDPDNIRIIDEGNLSVDRESLLEPYNKLPSDIYYKYSLENWVDTIINDKREEYLNDKTVC